MRLLDVEHERREPAQSDIFGQFNCFVTLKREEDSPKVFAKAKQANIPSLSWAEMSTWRVSNLFNRLISVARRVHGVPAGLEEKHEVLTNLNAK